MTIEVDEQQAYTVAEALLYHFGVLAPAQEVAEAIAAEALEEYAATSVTGKAADLEALAKRLTQIKA